MTRVQPNILIDGNHRAQLTDFGLATVTQNLDSIRSTSEHGGHTARWTAPEILNDVGTYSKEADVFSFAMVMIEVRQGRIILTGPWLIPVFIHRRRSPVQSLSVVAYPRQQCWQ